MGNSLLSDLDTSVFDPDVYIALKDLAADTETIFEVARTKKRELTEWFKVVSLKLIWLY